MLSLTKEEILLILNKIAEVEGSGYSKNPEICDLQMKLSLMLHFLK
jgi:hypothetical protein